jgi:hypothetical protein
LIVISIGFSGIRSKQQILLLCRQRPQLKSGHYRRLFYRLIRYATCIAGPPGNVDEKHIAGGKRQITGLFWVDPARLSGQKPHHEMLQEPFSHFVRFVDADFAEIIDFCGRWSG